MKNKLWARSEFLSTSLVTATTTQVEETLVTKYAIITFILLHYLEVCAKTITFFHDSKNFSR